MGEMTVYAVAPTSDRAMWSTRLTLSQALHLHRKYRRMKIRTRVWKIKMTSEPMLRCGHFKSDGCPCKEKR